MAGNLLYSTLIGNAISDFNSVYDKLVSRKATYNNSPISNKSVVPTSQYGKIIEDQLFRVGSRLKDSVVLVDGVIADHGELTISGLGPIIVAKDADRNSVTIKTTKGLTAGYYDGSLVEFSVDLVDAVLNSTTSDSFKVSNEDGSLKEYIISAPADALRGNVKVVKGDVSITCPEGSVENSFNHSAKVEVIETAGNAIMANENAPSADKVGIKLRATSTATGSLTVTPNKTVNQGYVTSSDVTISGVTTDLSGTTEDVKTIYIKAGKITVKGASEDAKVNLTSTDIDLLDDNSTEQDAYLLSASSGSVDINAKIEEGYIKGSENETLSGTITVTGTKYIKKGSVSLKGKTLNGVISGTNGIILNSTDTDAYELTVSGSDTISPVVKTGYIKEVSNLDANIDVRGTAKVPKASVKVGVANIGPESLTIAGEGGVYSATTGRHKIKITVPSISPVLDSTNKEGYLKTNEIVKTSSTKFNAEYILQDSEVTSHTTSLKTSFVCKDGKEKPDKFNANSIFLNAAPENGDYFIVAPSSRVVTSNGYTSGQDLTIDTTFNKDGTLKTSNGGNLFYVPKAKFKYSAAASDDGKDLLIAETAGFVPSGTIADIAEISGTLDSASVTVNVNDTNGITSPTGDYKLSFIKGETNAGFISNTQGEIRGDTFIRKGNVTPSLTKNALTTSIESADNKYYINISGSVKNEITLSEGYIKKSDFALAENSPYHYDSTAGMISQTITFGSDDRTELAKAVITPSKEISTKASATNGANTVALANNGSFFVTPAYSGSVTATVKTDGYATSAENQTVDIAETDGSRIYIKAGETRTGIAKTAEGSGSELNFTLGSNGKYKSQYTVSGIGANVRLTEGYYASDHEITGTLSVSKELTLDKAAIHVQSSAKSTLAANKDGVFADVSKVTNETLSTNYVKITATGNGSCQVADNGTSFGYFGNKSEVTCDSSNPATVDKYIALLNTSYDTTTAEAGNKDELGNNLGTTTVYAAGSLGSKTGVVCTDSSNPIATKVASSVSQKTDTDDVTTLRDSVYIDTSNKYAIYDTRVSLTEHAMGTRVVDALAVLQARMNGNYSATLA